MYWLKNLSSKLKYIQYEHYASSIGDTMPFVTLYSMSDFNEEKKKVLWEVVKLNFWRFS